jgi:predicted transcriptional regulator
MTGSEPMRAVVVRMSDDMKAELQRIADEENRSLSQVIRRAVKQYVERHTS